jgi:histone H3/H4
MPKACFSRLVREAIYEVRGLNEFRIQASALAALQEAAEAHLVRLFESKY